MYLYKIINKTNSHSYVGFTSKEPRFRYYQHCANAFKKGAKSKLYSAMRRDGKENFILETIYEGEDALQKENEFIVKYKAEYNMTPGGEANRLGIPHTANTKNLLSEKLKGKKKPPRTEKHNRNASLAQMGKTAWNKGKFQENVTPHAIYMRNYRAKRDK